MSVKTWKAGAGLFSSPWNWSSSTAPVAGDSLTIQGGAAIIANQTFGSDGVRSTIGLTGPANSKSSMLVLWNSTLKNVLVGNAVPSPTGPDYRLAKHGTVLIAGTVTNDGGEFEAGKGDLLFGGNSLDIVVEPNSTLINKGVIAATPGNQMTITGYGGSTLENDGSIVAAGGGITIATHLTGTGDVRVSRGAHFSGNLELKDAVDAGQTFHVSLTALQVDKPLSFLGAIDADPQQGGGAVWLEGLGAASWDVNGSAVEFFDAGGSMIDALRLTTPQAPDALTVYARPDPTFGSTVVVGTGPFFGPPTGTPLLPYHHAAT